MKKLTLKELNELTQIPTPTIRAWTLKPVIGEIFVKGMINQNEVHTKLHLMYKNEQTFEKLVGCKIDEVEIVKCDKTKHEYVSIDELEINNEYDIHNYSLCNRRKLVKIETINDIKVYIFVNENEFYIYKEEYLNKESIRFERV